MKQNLKLTPAFLQELAADVFLDLSETEILEILAVEEKIVHQFEKVLKINTTGIAPMSYPFETPRHYLREDDSEAVTIPQNQVLANAATTKGPYVTITKVIK